MMGPVEALRRRANLTQDELARRAGTSQPTIAAYESGVKSPTVRTLSRLAAAAGLDAAITFVPPMTREDRRSLFLHQAIAAKLPANPTGVLRRARANLRTMRAAQPGVGPLLDEWRRVLDRSVEEIVEAMLDPGVRARDLRQVTPFAGVLTTTERTAVYEKFRRSEERR